MTPVLAAAGVPPVLAHAGAPPTPHDLAGAWNLDPVLLVGFAVTIWLYRRGARRPVAPVRVWCFAAALLVLAVALLTPLDALAEALASAHMVQHVLLLLVAAPLLARSAPTSTLLRGAPPAVRRATGRWGRRIGLSRATLAPLRHPVAVWCLHVATLWLWHASATYDAALADERLHVLQHLTFLGTALLFWRVVVGARRGLRVAPGAGILLVFGMALQGVFLSVLLTFARAPWYAGYATTTQAWGLEPLADQQLAGVIMWIPSSAVYLGIALALLAAWLRTLDAPSRPSGQPTPRAARPSAAAAGEVRRPSSTNVP